MPGGRPTLNTEQMQAEICEWIAEGKSLAAWCRKGKADYSTVMRWLDADETFRNRYTRAREDSGDASSDKINDISDRVIAGELDPQAARVAIDALKWTASKLKPKKYGDKIDIQQDTKLEIILNQNW